MAESLRDLVVSLSLNTDNFTRNIRSVQRQIQEAQSEFQLAAAGIQNFEQTTEGLTAKLNTLERTLSLQADAVSQYEKALTAARDKLQECYDRQNDYAQRLQDARQKQADLADQVQRAQAAYDGYKNTLGESDSATIAAKQNLDALKDEYKLASDEVKKLEGQNEALKKSTQNAADAVSTANVKLNQANAAMRSTQAAIAQTNQELALAQTQWNAAGAAIDVAKNALTTIGKQMQQAESRFKLATAGIKDMDTSTVALAAKMTLLQEKITLQEQAVTQYEAALEAAKQQLEAAQQANDPTKTRQATDAVIDAQTSLNNARAALASLRAQLTQTNQQLRTAVSAWTAAGKSLTEFGDKCTKVGQAMTRMGKTLSMYVTTPITTLATTAVNASIEFESAFTDVRKVTNATEAEFGELSTSIKQMSTELAASTTEIAGVVTSASRLGIATEDLMDFTEVMINLGNSTDMTANDAATSIARFANIMGMSSDQYENLGSTLVALGNNYATTESEIMEMSLRLAGAGKQVGLSESQVLAFSAALSSLGIEAQMGGSSMSKALIKMEVASATGGEALADFGKVCGMTGAQFKTLWDSDPAAAFQAFIVGLSQMDEEGISAIAVLDEIGISEIRLRDTILRATNATDLFSSTQATANSAWKSGTELASVAEQRYATTASKLTNLKNSAMLFAQTIGDDLNPTIRKLIDGAGEIIDKLMALDSTQRMQIIKWAAFAAAIGPVILIIGKLTKTIGTISKGLGTFATAVGKAGGGFKGFMTVLSSSPAFWFAVAAATIAATVAIVDYVSGAKKAREALEGMKKTAEDWKNTAANTFYTGSKGLSFFGMSTDNFKSSSRESIAAAQDWLTGLLAVWSDGKKETNEIVTQWTDSWKSLTQTTRDGLTELKSQADAHGYTGLSTQMQADLDALDSMDKEIAKLLKKRQSKNFTADDQARLEELVNQRNTIMVRYHLVPAEGEDTGFDTIRSKLEAEVARAQAKGATDADISVYENAMVAAAQGMAATNQELNDQYDAEYALIQLITNETEREAALADLNTRYNAERKAAALEYAQLLQDIIMPVWNQDDIQQAGSDIGSLIQLMREYSVAAETDRPAILEQMNELTSSMDETSMIEYIGLLTQIQSLLDNGMSEADVQAMFPEIDFSTALDQIAAVQQFLSTRKGMLPGLESMFGEAIPEEMLTITTDLDMTGAQARWDEFAANPGAITTEAIISKYNTDAEGAAQAPLITAFVAKYTEVPEGASTASLTPTGLVAYVSTYAKATTGADTSGITPENITAFVAGYQELAAGADISTLKPEEIVAYVSSYAQAQGVDMSGITPEALTAFVLAYEEVTGGALTTSLTPDNITAMVVAYAEAEGIDLSKLKPDQIEAMVSSFAEATGCDKSALLTSFTAVVTEYQTAAGVTTPKPSTVIAITGYDLTAYNQFVSQHPVTVTGIVRLGEIYQDPEDALSEDNVRFYDLNGIEIPVTAVPTELLTASTVAALDEDGTIHVLVTPQVQGTQESVETAAAALNSTEHQGSIGAKMFGDDTFADMKRLNEYLTKIKGEMNSFLNIGGWMDGWDRKAAADTISNYLDPTEIGNITTFVTECIAAINNGEELSDDAVAKLQEIQELVSLMDAIGVGQDIIGGIAEGMTSAGMDTTAETVASNLESVLEGAFIINSPSKRMMPIGEYVSAGIAEGMSGYDMSAAGSAVGSSVESALKTGISVMSMRSVGVNAMAGLKAGIIAGRSGVIAAMKAAAKSAVTAAKTELQIHSPSRVFRDEVGTMAMRGFGEGILRESKEQASVIRNASRFLTGEAKEGAITPVNTTNTHTYQQDSSVNFTGSTFYIRDEKDVQSLAIEIATLTRRRQHGRGLKMA